MFEERFLEQALDELQSLRDENEELKRRLSLYEEFVKDLKEILKKEKENEKRILRKVYKSC
jgi:regulator of replication initiation timing